MKLVLHIDRLVLNGVDPAERAALVRALHAGLERTLAESGAASRVAALQPSAHIRLPALRPQPGQTLGDAAAAALSRGLQR